MNRCLKPYPQTYFSKLSIYENTPKVIHIEIPDVQYLYYIIANTLQARNEITRLNDEDIVVLAKAAIPNNNLSLNLGAVLVRYLDFQSFRGQGPITCGGVITVLAIALGLNFGNLQPLRGE